MVVRGVAITFATAPVAAAEFQALLVPALMGYCEDACDGTYWQLHTGRAAAITVVLAAVLVSECVLWWCVARGRPRAAARWFVIQAGLALMTLGYWIEVSTHSDDRLVSTGGSVEVLAFLALVICHGEARQRDQATL